MDEIENTENKEAFQKALLIASRVIWGIVGGMVLLIFMSERLYQENIMFPYAAKIAAVVFLIFGSFFDSCYINSIYEGKIK